MNAHDRFEMLAGAVALGEATPQERLAFEAHATRCPDCREDAAGAAFVTAKIAEAHESETWRPQQTIVERIRARRSGRARFTLGALGWAVGLSLVLNVAIAGGIGTRLVGAFSAHADTASVSSAVSLDAPHLAIAAPQVRHRPPVAFAELKVKKRVHVPAHTIAAVSKPAAPAKVEKLPTLDDMPDVLAGLDLYGTGAKNHVAIETLPRCKAQNENTDAAEAADVRPCRDANGRVVR